MSAHPLQDDISRSVLVEDLLRGVKFRLPCGALAVSGISTDSRTTAPGDLFFAISGTKHDGRDFVGSAVRRGAGAVVAQEPIENVPVPLILVEDVRRALALAAAELFERPADRMTAVAVTGTNGKTSTSWLIAWALQLLGRRTALVGTLGAGMIEQGASSLADTGATTPDAISLQRFFSRSCAAGAEAFAMEVSSHALVQHRTAGIPWDCAVFTNLTRDHLDYHGSFAEYGTAKAKLFVEELAASTKPRRTAVLNIDDPFGVQLAQRLEETGIKLHLFGSSPRADVALADTAAHRAGAELAVRATGETVRFATRLVGDYNVQNCLAAFAALLSLGFSPRAIAGVFPQIPAVPGRLELVAAEGFSVFVDYAHTPDALLKAQQSLRKLTAGRLITVFGCGGDRDRGKRPQMARVVGELSDLAIVTSDNPRSESAQAIIGEIVSGFSGSSCSVSVEVDRRRAIGQAIALARSGDVVLVAGKGHEPYQEVDGVRYPFLDREVCAQAVAERSSLSGV